MKYIIPREHRLPNMDVAGFYIANQLDLLSTVQGVAETFTDLLAEAVIISLIGGAVARRGLCSVTQRGEESEAGEVISA